jgi:hypothetical protein
MYAQKTDLSEILDNVGDDAAARFVELMSRKDILIQQQENQDVYVELNKIINELYEIRQMAGLVSSR